MLKRNQGLISFPLVVLTNLLVTHHAFAAGPSTTAMLVAVRNIPYQTSGIPDTSGKAVTKNLTPLIHDDVWVAQSQEGKTGSTGCIRIGR